MQKWWFTKRCWDINRVDKMWEIHKFLELSELETTESWLRSGNLCWKDAKPEASLQGSTKWVFSPKIIGNMLHNDPNLIWKKMIARDFFECPPAIKHSNWKSLIYRCSHNGWVFPIFSHSFPFSFARPSKTPVGHRPRKRLPGCRGSRGGNLVWGIRFFVHHETYGNSNKNGGCTNKDWICDHQTLTIN